MAEILTRTTPMTEIDRRSIANTLADWLERPFEWGKSDCVHFAGAIIGAATGTNPMDGYLDYRNEQRAAQIIGLHGNLKDTITSWLDRPPGKVQDYDFGVVLVDSPLGHMAGILLDDRVLVKTPDGVVDLPGARAFCAWPF